MMFKSKVAATVHRIAKGTRWIDGIYRLFFLWIIAVVIVRHELNVHHFNPKEDGTLLFCVVCVLVISLIIMFVQTHTRVHGWTAVRMGVFGLVAFDAIFYGLISIAALWGWNHTSEHDLNTARAILVVSAPLMFVGQVQFIFSRLRGRKAPQAG